MYKKTRLLNLTNLMTHTITPTREHDLPPVEAMLDDEECLDNADEPEGVMSIFLRAVHDRLKNETSGSKAVKQWLLPMLKQDGRSWWIRNNDAKYVCSKLHILYDEPAYYRDILVWLPDERWDVMPPCVHRLIK